MTPKGRSERKGKEEREEEKTKLQGGGVICDEAELLFCIKKLEKVAISNVQQQSMDFDPSSTDMTPCKILRRRGKQALSDLIVWEQPLVVDTSSVLRLRLCNLGRWSSLSLLSLSSLSSRNPSTDQRAKRIVLLQRSRRLTTCPREQTPGRIELKIREECDSISGKIENAITP